MLPILIVDDEPAIAALISRVLTAAGYTCQAVTSSEKAADLIQQNRYDLVLLEGFKSSGWSKIEVVRSAISDTPVSFQPLALVGDIPGADFDLDDISALADWIQTQMPAL